MKKDQKISGDMGTSLQALQAEPGKQQVIHAEGSQTPEEMREAALRCRSPGQDYSE